MNIEIHREGRNLSAMGHLVAETQGGAAELKRRCLETLSRYDTPPDEIRFTVVGPTTQAGPPDAALVAPQAITEAPPPERPARGPGLAKAKERKAR